MTSSTPSRRLLLPLLLTLLAPVAPAQGRGSADESYRYIAGLVDKGLYDLAVGEAQTFLREHADHPKAPLARYRLGCALFELGRREEAAPHFQALAAADGFEYRAECAFRLGECELERAHYDAARAAFTSVLDSDQEYLFPAARFFLGDALFRAAQRAEAEACFAELLRSTPDSEYAARARAARAWCAWQGKDAPETERRVREFLAKHPQDEAADEMRVLLGEALLEQKKEQEALQAFRAVTSAGQDDAARRGVAFALAQAGDHAGAAREFRGLVEAHPDSRFAAEARLEAGVQTLLAGDAQGALPALAEAAKGGDGEALYWLGRAQAEAGEREKALPTLERALKGASGDLRERIQVARGDVLRALGRTDAAIQAYEGGGSDYSLYAAAVTALSEARADDAIRLAGDLLERHPTSKHRVDAELVLAEASFSKRDLVRAEQTFRAVLAEDPPPASAAQAQSRLAWCRYLAGDLPAAREGFERLVREHPSDEPTEEAWCLWGRIELESGANERALDVLGRYLREHPQGKFVDQALSLAARARPGSQGVGDLVRLVDEHPESPLVPAALLDLGDRLSAAGRTDEAVARYQELLEKHASAPEAPQARYGLAWCELGRERYDACAELARGVLQDGAASEELRASAAELCIWAAARAGDASAASQAWRAYLRFPCDDAKRLEAARAVVDAWRKAGKLGEAKGVLDDCLKSVRDPNVALATLVEGAYLALEEGDVERADAQVEVARRRDPQSSEAAEGAFFVAEARAKAGASERALELYRRALAVPHPHRAEALYKLGFAQLSAGALDESAQAFEELARDPQGTYFGEALFLLGEVRYRQERYADAVAVLERVRREAPGHEIQPKALFRLGLALGQLERWSESEAVLAELARSASDFPNLAEAELARGRALAAQKKMRPARAALERVVALDQGELAARARLVAAGLSDEEGKTEEALAEYLKVALLYSHEESVAEALYRAGLCLERLGRADQAAARWREVVDDHPRSKFASLARERLAGAARERGS